MLVAKLRNTSTDYVGYRFGLKRPAYNVGPTSGLGVPHRDDLQLMLPNVFVCFIKKESVSLQHFIKNIIENTDMIGI